MKLELFRATHEHPFWEELAWADRAARQVMSNNYLEEILEFRDINDSVLLKLSIIDRVLRERMIELQRKKRKIAVPRAIRRVFNFSPVDVGLCLDASVYVSGVRQEYVDLRFQGDQRTQRAKDIGLAANDLFKRVQEETHMVLGPSEYIDDRMLKSWGDAWRPRIKGFG